MVAFLTHEKKALLLALSKIKTPLTPSETRPNVLQTVLLAINEGGRGAFGKDMMTVLVLFDFSKTFDSITHKADKMQMLRSITKMVFNLSVWESSSSSR